MLNYRWKRLWVVLAFGALAGFSLDVAVAQAVPVHRLGRFTWLASGNWVKSAQTLVKLILGALLPMLLSFFGFFSSSGSLNVAKRLRFWLLLAVPAVIAGASFVGPPRDRQPLLWEAPQGTSERRESEQRDQQLSKRVRAVAIGSAGGILLSLVVQSITPEEPQPQYYYYQPAPRVYRRPALAAPPPPPSSGQSFSFSSLTTGLLVGLGTGMIIGSSMTEDAEEDARSARSTQPFSKGENDGGSNAPHALENKSAPIRGKNSQRVK
eukprot:Skav224887  [mRNA]  locus=scaffold1112:283189:283986:+ [translate_table: standard]